MYRSGFRKQQTIVSPAALKNINPGLLVQFRNRGGRGRVRKGEFGDENVDEGRVENEVEEGGVVDEEDEFWTRR